MDRVIEHENRKYKIERSGNIVFSATLEGGTTLDITRLGFFDPEFHEKMGFTTIASVLKWWMVNRDAVYRASVEAGQANFLETTVVRYFGYIPREFLFGIGYAYDDLKEFLSGHLRTKSLSFSLRSRAPSGFQLVQLDEPEGGVIEASVTDYRIGTIVLRPAAQQETPTPTDEKWTNVWNYTFRMDKDEFNWFRSVSGENNVFFGMELELNTKLKPTEIQYIVSEVEPKQEPFFIFKQDSSITGKYSQMVELVTVPCTPRYLRKNLKIFFQKVQKLAEAKGKTIGDFFDTSRGLNNGLHVHVSKDSFISRSHYNKFLTAWNQWEDGVVNLLNEASARPTLYKDNYYCTISHEYIQTKSKGKTTLTKFERRHAQRSLAKRLRGIPVSSRTSVAHDSNPHTIEVRVFQGIFDLTHVMQSISFTEAMFEYCAEVGYSGFDKYFVPTFSKFVTKQRKFASLFSLIEKGTAQCA